MTLSRPDDETNFPKNLQLVAKCQEITSCRKQTNFLNIILSKIFSNDHNDIGLKFINATH